MLIFSTWRGSFELSRKIVTRLGGVTSSLCLSFPDSKLSLAKFLNRSTVVLGFVLNVLIHGPNL